MNWSNRTLCKIPAINSPDDIAAIKQLLRKYEDVRADLADITLVYLAHVHDTHDVFTLDRRDFNIYRAKRDRAFRIVP